MKVMEILEKPVLNSRTFETNSPTISLRFLFGICSIDKGVY